MPLWGWALVGLGVFAVFIILVAIGGTSPETPKRTPEEESDAKKKEEARLLRMEARLPPRMR